MKIKHFFLFILLASLLLCNCKNAHEAKESADIGARVFGGVEIIFNKKEIVVSANKNNVSFKTSELFGGMEIIDIVTIIDNDTIHFPNVKEPREVHFSRFPQIFYYYRDTVYGDWYTAIHKNRKIHVKVNENKTGRERKLLVNIRDDNCWGSVAVTQKATK